MRRDLFLVGCTLAITAGSMAAWTPAAMAETLPADRPPLLVRETENELAALGCRLLPAGAARQETGTQLRAAVGSDADGSRVAWCPAQAIGQLEVAPTGEVAGIQSLLAPDALADDTETLKAPSFSGLWKAMIDRWKAGGVGINAVWRAGALIGLGVLLTIASNAAVLLVMFILKFLLLPLLQVDAFVYAPVVRAMWPIALGIANLSFMIALLVIALLTVLKIEWGQAKKMLPRLFIGALLVNFSLVIAGAILDFSRVMMAALMLTLRPPGLGAGTLGEALVIGLGNLLSLDLISGAILNFLVWLGVPASWVIGYIIGAIALLLKLIIALAVTRLLLKLIYRYLLLLFLLIVSPFPYLAHAFPGKRMEKLRDTWWNCFLKAVLAGPAFLLLLLGSIYVLDPSGAFIQSLLNTLPGGNFEIMIVFVNIAVLIVMFWLSGYIGDKLLCGPQSSKFKLPFLPLPMPGFGGGGGSPLPKAGTTPPPRPPAPVPNPPGGTSGRPSTQITQTRRQFAGVATPAAITDQTTEPVSVDQSIRGGLAEPIRRERLATVTERSDSAVAIPRRAAATAGLATNTAAEVDLRQSRTEEELRQLPGQEVAVPGRTASREVPLGRPLSEADLKRSRTPEIDLSRQASRPRQLAAGGREGLPPSPEALEANHARRLQEVQARDAATAQRPAEGAAPERRMRSLDSVLDEATKPNVPEPDAAAATPGSMRAARDAVSSGSVPKVPGETFGTDTRKLVGAGSDGGSRVQDTGARAGEPPAPRGRLSGGGAETTVTPGSGAGAGGQSAGGSAGAPGSQAAAEGAAPEPDDMAPRTKVPQTTTPTEPARLPGRTVTPAPTGNVLDQAVEQTGSRQTFDDIIEKTQPSRSARPHVGLDAVIDATLQERAARPSEIEYVSQSPEGPSKTAAAQQGGADPVAHLRDMGVSQDEIDRSWQERQRQKRLDGAAQGRAQQMQNAATGQGAGRAGGSAGAPGSQAAAEGAAPEPAGRPNRPMEYYQREGFIDEVKNRSNQGLGTPEIASQLGMRPEEVAAIQQHLEQQQGGAGRAGGSAGAPGSQAAAEGAAPEPAQTPEQAREKYIKQEEAQISRLAGDQQRVAARQHAHMLAEEAKRLANKAVQQKGPRAVRQAVADSLNTQADTYRREASIYEAASNSTSDPKAMLDKLLPAEKSAVEFEHSARSLRSQAQGLRGAEQANLLRKAEGFEQLAQNTRRQARAELRAAEPGAIAGLERAEAGLKTLRDERAGRSASGKAARSALGEAFTDARQQTAGEAGAAQMARGLEPAEGASGILSRTGRAVGRAFDTVGNIGKTVTESRAARALRGGAIKSGAATGGVGMITVLTDDAYKLITGKNLLSGRMRKAAEVVTIGGAALTGLSSVAGAVVIAAGTVADQGYRLFNKRGEGFLEQQGRRMSETGKLLGAVGTGTDPITKIAGSGPLAALKGTGPDFSGRTRRRARYESATTDRERQAFGELTDEQRAHRVQINPAADPKYLAMPGYGAKLSARHRIEIVRFGSHAQKSALLTNLEAVRRMTAGERQLIDGLQLDQDEYINERLHAGYNSMMGRIARGE
ncbi:MAG: hypothetical protein COT71_00875 [Candidatus Andersenbacteria bacterium CG10_big_fil_rev_8_21_14_0_10_54_11]|uniref:Uncharacterized protein n=1 Tax=Candidatus Andersenbacteria bacterium CG10_big_fil_rev_8_21_14_0_10_54_11 TaxID=1974485 RepID=A0A2M6X0A0_9BACT|nr:MAG: hypothetical protein COT71_00875 [Candidatus Andersenbacteria bacterium CG10_big_fil_rev_8_21_14_0_10_54_11]